MRCVLADGRKYLVGDRLTLADLAFATSGAPMVLADGYGGHLPTIDKVPPEMKPVMTALRARPAGASTTSTASSRPRRSRTRFELEHFAFGMSQFGLGPRGEVPATPWSSTVRASRRSLCSLLSPHVHV